jgi:hypothetical protein
MKVLFRHDNADDALVNLSMNPINIVQNFLVFRIHRIHVFFGLPDPDPLVRGMDPDPDHHAKIIRKTLNPTIL